MPEFKVSKLKYELKKYKKVVLYGTGYFSRKMYQEMIQQAINVPYFVVTRKIEEKWNNIPIYEFKEKQEELSCKDVAIIIAVTEKYENEIEHILLQNTCYNYLKATDYLWNENIYQRYKDKNKEQYLLEIAEWLVDKQNDDYEQIEIVKKELKTRYKSKERNFKKIVFTVIFASARIRKIAELLKNHGYDISVLDFSHIAADHDTGMIKGIKKFCTWYHKCESVEDIMYHLLDEDAFVNHIFNAGDSSAAFTLINMKELFPTVVYEQYDIYNGMYIKPFQKECMLERLCLENADGICNRGYELDYVKNELHFQIKGKVLRFLDYCQKFFEQETVEENELSLCYAGGIVSVTVNSKNRFYCFEELAELCKKNHCHLHLYPIIYSDELRNRYTEIEKINPYFHVHQLVEYDQLIEEISCYDYGILPAIGNIDELEDGYCTKNKFIYAATNKYFSYLEAGLPIITVEPRLFLQEITKRGMAIELTIDQYDFVELRCRRREMKQNVLKNRKYFDIENHFESLVNFYKSLS